MKAAVRKIMEEYPGKYPALEACRADMYAALESLTACFASGGKLLVCGNGGSASDALHIVGELMKGFVLPRRLEGKDKQRIAENCPDADYMLRNLQGALPAIALVSETALMTAYANDEAPDLCFAQQVWGYGREGDALLCITTSGNSKNTLYAAEAARARGMRVIGLTGQSGGKLAPLSDICIRVPAVRAHEVQELHLPVYHCLCLALEETFYGRGED